MQGDTDGPKLVLNDGMCVSSEGYNIL